MSKLIKSVHRFWLSGIWSILTLVLCFMPNNDSINISFFSQMHLDKLAHIIIYLIMAFLLKRDNLDSRSVFIFCFLMGLAIEICQGYFLPSRYFEFYDLIANIIGYFIGIGLYKLIKNKAYV